MRNSTGLVVALACAFTASLCRAKIESNEPNAADLVRAVRESEMWMYHFESLYLRAKGKWTNTPEALAKRRAEIKKEFNIEEPNEKQFTGLRKTGEDILEYAVDRKRIRYLTDDTGYWRQLKIWDGNDLRIHEKYYNHPQNYYILYNKIPYRMFHELFECYYGWPRSQAHSFWWNPQDVNESMDFYGRPENFKLIGRQIYRQIPCYMLEYDVQEHIVKGLVLRWYVGQSDHLLYGLQIRRDGQLDVEYWTLDYRQVVPGGWFPMKTGWSIYDTDETGRTYLESIKNYEVIDFQLNKSLHEDLFQLIIEPGVEVQDHRSGELHRYILWPSLLGKTLPSFEKFNLSESVSIKGGPILLCFLDLEQRPSRHLVNELKNHSEILRSNSIEVLLIQSSVMSAEILSQWQGKLGSSFKIATMTGDLHATRWSWGIEALPWLILTDREHVVVAEGFGLDELDEKIKEVRNENR
ncbi:MAG: hypothetical protein A2168_05825 [Planctomycetes bacterium RBG_13_50_24]|nr:MAG: hypothetical protein A2168_05825 [Planctomycetes bacterium RBG_13_50_24]